MENRFGLKDFFLFALVGLLLVVVGLHMFQSSRQWDRLQDVAVKSDQLAVDVSRFGDKLDEVTRTSGNGGSTPTVVQNFYGVSGDGQQAMPNPPTPTNVVPQPDQAAAMEDPDASPEVTVAGATFAAIEEAEQADDFSREGTFLDNFGTKIGRLTPLVSSDIYQIWVEYLVLESLIQRNAQTLEFEPRLAESWEISEDGLTFVYTLRDGLRFSDGEPLTSEDVVWTFDWIRNPEVQADRTRSYLTKLDTVTALDERRVEFKFSEPYFLNFGFIGSIGIMPKHFYENYTPTQFNESIGLLMGSGQYMLPNPTSWTPAEDVTLVRNPRYWGEPGTIERINFKQISEEAVEEVMFRNGQLDRLGATPEVFDKLKSDDDILKQSKTFNYFTPYGGYTYIGWNQLRRDEDGAETPTKFADARVRKALTMLTDRQRLADDLYRGYAQIASGPFAVDSPQSNPEIDPWPRDVAAAQELLAEAGWRDTNGDGILDDGQGTDFEFKLMYPGGSELVEQIVLSLRDDMAEGGVLLVAERVDWPVLVERLKQSDFEAATLGWSGSIESDPYQIFHSDNAKAGGDNRTGYRSERLDAAIERARVTVDPEERMPIWHEVHQILHEDQPYTFLLNRQALRFFNGRVRNVETSKLGLNYEFLNGGVLPWYIARGSQMTQ
jgi:peptide/nickel transport system substrate-binding protein